ncbi:MAG: cell division protein FtsQ/DivIB [Lachnospiraceae bacterium]|nr:cell division protein FtsQ/DivIB [Lachnospiraceae bacterium]
MSRRKRKGIVIVTILFILAVCIGILAMQRIDNKSIIIEGNEKYTNDEMINFIFKSDWDKNPFMLYYRTKYGNQKRIPFVDAYEVEIISLNNVKITVYEKKIIGYVYYMGTNMYFDKDGTVVESSGEVLEGVPLVTGLNFDKIVLYEELPVGNDEVFNLILDTTQTLQKYNIGVDKIYISEGKEVTLYIGEIEVLLGSDEDMNDKIRSLNDMLPNLAGLSGTLDLRVYNENSTGYTFRKSK